ARLAEIGASLLVETLGPLERGEIDEIPQDDGQATYAARILKTDGVIVWNVPARAIHDHVRALNPSPHAFTFHDAARYVIHETPRFRSLETAWHAAGHEPPIEERGTMHRPGSILEAPRGKLLVAAGEGTVVDLLRLQEEGRRVLTARELLAGRAFAP